MIGRTVTGEGRREDSFYTIVTGKIVSSFVEKNHVNISGDLYLTLVVLDESGRLWYVRADAQDTRVLRDTPS